MQKTMSGSFLVKNKYRIIREGINAVIWQTISKRSVLHLDELSDYEKNTFKTAIEINQQWVIERTLIDKYVCQAQSVNVFVPDVNIKELHATHVGLEKKNKIQYYYRRKSSMESYYQKK